MDHLKQGLPSQVVAEWYNLTPTEMDAVMQFLKEHEAEIERSYAAANARAAAQRRYWEAKNRDVLARDVRQVPPPPNADARWFALRDKLIAARKKLIDHNIEGFAPLLLGVLAKEGRSETTLPANSDDATVWRYAKNEGMILLTSNRNRHDDTSLQATIEREDHPSALPVITLSHPEHLWVSAYRLQVALKIAEIIISLDYYRGTGRLFVP
jgi:hypothetical protein